MKHSPSLARLIDALHALPGIGPKTAQRLANARAALETDPAVQALRTQMGATIFADSVRPNHTEEN